MDAPLPEPAPEPLDAAPGRCRWGFAAALAVILAGLALTLAPRLDDPFGRSFDGDNAVVWSRGAGAIRDRGLIGSAFGARRHDDLFDVYAAHPPALPVAIWAVQEVTGSRAPWTVRLLPVAATVSAAALLACLVRPRLGDGAALVTAAAFSVTGLVQAYGSMADTWIVSLPAAVGLLVLAERRRLGGPLAVIGAMACVLTSWQSLLAALLVVLAYVRRPWRRHAGLLGGLVAGGGMLIAWLGQIGLDPLVDRAQLRSSGGWSDAASTQSDVLAELVRPVLLVLAVIGVWRTRRQPGRALVVAAAAPVAYLVAFHGGAAVHRYWCYWLALPVALAVGAVADFGRRAVVVTLLVLTGLWAWSLHDPPPDLDATDDGVELARALAPLEPPRGQRYTYVVTDTDYLPWLAGLWHRPVRAVDRVDAAPPGSLVISGDDAGCTPVLDIAVCRADTP